MSADVLSPDEALAQAKAKAGIHSFNLNGHTYNVIPHGMDGAIWCIELADIAGSALSRIAQGRLVDLIDMFEEGSELRQMIEAKGLDADLIELFRAIAKKLDRPDDPLNLTGTVADITAIMRSVGPDGLATLFQHTTRDGIALVGQELDSFCRSNWAEWRDVLAKIWEINRFSDFLAGGSGSGQKADESQAPG